MFHTNHEEEDIDAWSVNGAVWWYQEMCEWSLEHM